MFLLEYSMAHLNLKWMWGFGSLLSVCFSISLDPLYPSRCSWETFGYAAGCGLNGDCDELSPLGLSARLNSLACSVSFHQGESVSMVKLIEQVWGALACTHAVGSCLKPVPIPFPHQKFLYILTLSNKNFLKKKKNFLNLSAVSSGETHHLRHSQVLPLPTAVSTDTGHHSSEKKNRPACYLQDIKFTELIFILLISWFYSSWPALFSYLLPWTSQTYCGFPASVTHC